jgi:L-ornithine Nalpha-acyltransferase
VEQTSPQLTVRLAADDADLRAAQRLRYRVFVHEMGGDGPLVDHDAGLERDALDPYFDHMLLIDPTRDPRDGTHVVGAYRLLPDDRLAQTGHFYCDSEFDLSPLRDSGRKLLELGRSCVDPSYRGGSGMLLMWQSLAAYVAEHDIDILFGAASFRGTDAQALAQPLSLLHHRHLAPEGLRVNSRVRQPMDLLTEAQLDHRAAMAALPPLIRAYLRLGGVVGDGAFVDHLFQTTDICLILDTAAMSASARSLMGARG